MPRTSLVLSGLALACLAAGAEGQSIAPLRLGVALGPSFGGGEWWWPDGGHAALSLTSQPVGSRFGLRVEAVFDGDTRGSRSDDGTRYTQRHTTALLTMNATYRLVGRRTGLYAIAGLGAYHRWSELQVHSLRSGDELRRASMTAFDANLGLGFDFKAFGREVFVESRVHGTAFGDRVPLSLGIRF